MHGHALQRINVHATAHVHTHALTHARMPERAHAPTHSRARTLTNACTRARTHALTCTHTLTRNRTHSHARTHTHTLTPTNTHMGHGVDEQGTEWWCQHYWRQAQMGSEETGMGTRPCSWPPEANFRAPCTFCQRTKVMRWPTRRRPGAQILSPVHPKRCWEDGQTGF